MASQPGKFPQGNRPPNRGRFQRQDTVQERPVDGEQYDPQLVESVKVSVMSGNLGDVQKAVLGLQGRGNSINIRIEGRTLLHHVLLLAEEQVAMQQRTAIAAFLLSQGIEVNALDEARRTPLFLAAERRMGPIVKLLLEHGANPHVPDRFRNYPLHAACRPQLVQCPVLVQSTDFMKVPLSFVSSKQDEVVYDTGIVQYIKKTMEGELRKYLMNISQLLINSVEVDKDIKNNILQLYLPTTNPLEQYHSIYQKVYKKLGDKFPALYRGDNIFQLNDRGELPENFLLSTFVPTNKLVEDNLRELENRRKQSTEFFRTFRPDINTTKKLLREELSKAIKNIIQMTFMQTIVDHMNNASRNNETFQLYSKYLEQLGKESPQDFQLNDLVDEAFNQWKEQVLELPIDTLKEFFATLGTVFQVPPTMVNTNPTKLSEMEEKYAPDPPTPGLFSVSGLFYFLNNYLKLNKNIIIQHTVKLYLYDVYKNLSKMEEYRPPEPLNGLTYMEIGQDLLRFRKNSVYMKMERERSAPKEQVELLKKIIEIQTNAQKKKNYFFVPIEELTSSITLDLMKKLIEEENEFLENSRRQAFYSIVANFVLHPSHAVMFPYVQEGADIQWESLLVANEKDAFAATSKYFDILKDVDVRDLDSTSIKKRQTTLLNHERLLVLLLLQWLYEFHELTPYMINKKSKKPTENIYDIRQMNILSVKMLEQVSDLVKNHLDLQRYSISYIICFKIYNHLLKTYMNEEIKKKIGNYLQRLFGIDKAEYVEDIKSNVLEIKSFKLEKEITEKEKRFINIRKLQPSVHLRVEDRINDYIQQMKEQMVELEKNVFMDKFDASNWHVFMLKPQKEGSTTDSHEVFQVDRRVSTSICYAPTNEVVDLLLSSGANLNAQNNRNETAIFEVIRTLNLPLFRSLVRAGAGLLTVSNVLKEKPIDIICTQFHKHAHYQYLVPQTVLVIREQITKISNKYDLSFVEHIVNRVFQGIWRPVHALKDPDGKYIRIDQLKPSRKNAINALFIKYREKIQDAFLPDDSQIREALRPSPLDSSTPMHNLLLFMNDVQQYFRGGVAYLEDVRDLRTRTKEAIAIHNTIYQYIEGPELTYNFQGMLEELFRDEVPQRPPSELYTFIMEKVVLAELEPDEQEKVRSAVSEQLNVLESILKKRAIQQSLEPTASLNAVELVKHLFGLLQGLPEIQGRSLVVAQNFTTTCYESVINAFRDLYFAVSSAHRKLHILLEMLHTSLQHIEQQISN